MSSYPRLTEMGVLHPEHIVRYSINSVDYVDYLRLVYNRPKGSILPVSRMYRFPRVQKTAKKGDEPGGEVVMASCPELLEVVEELKTLMASREGMQDTAAIMLDELRCLEEDVASHTEKLKALIEELQPG